MIDIFETCQTKSIANQTNRDESLIIRSISLAHVHCKCIQRPVRNYSIQYNGRNVLLLDLKKKDVHFQFSFCRCIYLENIHLFLTLSLYI